MFHLLAQTLHSCAGEPAWNHSESKKRLHLEQIQAEAVTGSGGLTHPQPGISDYDSRKQERMQAIKSVLYLCFLIVSQTFPAVNATNAAAHVIA